MVLVFDWIQIDFFSDVQQLDKVAVGSENARRYFQGIEGDADNKGELFGVRNMFRLRTGDSCLTMDILSVSFFFFL